MSSHARLLDKACYGALRGTSRAGERTSEKEHSSVAIRENLTQPPLVWITFSLSPSYFFSLPSFKLILENMYYSYTYSFLNLFCSLHFGVRTLYDLCVHVK